MCSQVRITHRYCLYYCFSVYIRKFLYLCKALEFFVWIPNSTPLMYRQWEIRHQRRKTKPCAQQVCDHDQNRISGETQLAYDFFFFMQLFQHMIICQTSLVVPSNSSVSLCDVSIRWTDSVEKIQFVQVDCFNMHFVPGIVQKPAGLTHVVCEIQSNLF